MCELRLFDMDEVKTCLSRLDYNGRVVIFGDSLLRRVTEALAFPSDTSKEILNQRLAVQSRLVNDKWGTSVFPWLADPVANSSRARLSFVNACHLDALRDLKAILGTLDALAKHASDETSGSSSSGMDLVVVGFGMHSAHLVDDPQVLRRRVGDAVGLLRHFLARRDPQGRWVWHTRVLWVLPHKPWDEKAQRRPYLHLNSETIVARFVVAVRSLLHELDVPYLDTWAITEHLPEAVTADGMHLPAYFFRMKAQAILNYLCAPA